MNGQLRRTRIARTLLVLGLVLGVDIASVTAEETPPPPESCSASRRGGGIGGNHVTCAYSCKATSTLVLTVNSADRDASVSGSALCADSAAHCTGLQACSGAGPAATYASTSGKCEGRSDEAWRSSLSISCVTRTPRPVCTPITCPEEGGAVGPPEELSLALILVDGAGEAAGMVCARKECLPVLPTERPAAPDVRATPETPAAPDETREQVSWVLDEASRRGSRSRELQERLDALGEEFLLLVDTKPDLDDALAEFERRVREDLVDLRLPAGKTPELALA